MRVTNPYNSNQNTFQNTKNDKMLCWIACRYIYKRSKFFSNFLFFFLFSPCFFWEYPIVMLVLHIVALGFWFLELSLRILDLSHQQVSSQNFCWLTVWFGSFGSSFLSLYFNFQKRLLLTLRIIPSYNRIIISVAWIWLNSSICAEYGFLIQ